MPQIPRSIPNQTSGGGVSIETHRSELVWQHLSRFCVIYGIGWLLALACIGLVAAALNYSWPRDSFNYTPADRYGDLTRSWSQAIVPNPYKAYGKAFEGSYFPPAYAFLRLFRSFTSKTVVLIFMFGSYAGMASMWVWWLRRQRPIWKSDSRWPMVAILSLFVVLCSYPMAVAIDRGNIDPWQHSCCSGRSNWHDAGIAWQVVSSWRWRRLRRDSPSRQCCIGYGEGPYCPSWS